MVSVAEISSSVPVAEPFADHSVGSLEARSRPFNPLAEPEPGMVLASICVVIAFAMFAGGWFIVLPLPLIGVGLGLAAAADRGVVRTPIQRAIPNHTQVLWRCAISTVGNTAVTAEGNNSLTVNRAPQDVLALTTSGIHLLNVVAPSERSKSHGHSEVAAAATAAAVREALDGVSGLDDFADLAGRKLDALVSEDGYLAVVLADPSNVVYTRAEVRRACLNERQFVSGYYFELELSDGTLDRRDILVSQAKRLELEQLLQDHNYAI